MNLGTRANVKADTLRLPFLTSELFSRTAAALPAVEPAVCAG
jgi:hypothetical protein